MKIIKEEFNSIKEFLNTINNRNNNEVMKDRHDSKEWGNKSFYGTKSYEEATNLIENGYTEILSEIKNNSRIQMKPTGNQNRRIPRNAVVGYTPNVPNAILGLPQSMITIDRIKQKAKTLSIVYNNTGNGCMKKENYIKCGVTILNLINVLELSGVRVNLKVSPKLSRSRHSKKNKHMEYCYLTVKIKDYREHLNLQKICFPMAHPSMQRRFGFKWIETNPNITDDAWSFGYGNSFVDYEDEELKELLAKCLGKDEVFINIPLIEKCDYKVEKLIEYLKNENKL